jgi:hypothetical protein
MESHEFERESRIAETILCEVAQQRKEPMAFVFRRAAAYCSAIYAMWYYESGRARNLDSKVKELERRLEVESKHHQWFKDRANEYAQQRDRLQLELTTRKLRKGRTAQPAPGSFAPAPGSSKTLP